MRMPSAMGQARRAGMLLAALLALPAAATAPQLHFEHIDGQRGLAQGYVHALLQDRQGYVWIATEGGLHRYDGYAITTFQHDPDRSNSLPDNRVLALADASEGDIWVATGDGSVMRFDTRKQNIRSVAHTRPDDPATLLFTDAEGTLWIARTRTLLALSAQGGQPVEAYRYEHPETPFGSGSLTQMSQCPDGAIYAATNDGILAVAIDGTHVLGNPDPVSGIDCDHRNRLFAGNDHGIAEIDRATGTRHAIHTFETPVHAGQLVEDRRDTLWLGLRSDGLLRISVNGTAAARIDTRDDDRELLPDFAASRLMLDRSGLLWIGTQTRGVLITDPAGTPVRRLGESQARSGNGGDRQDVRSILQDANGDYWVGTHGAGLLRYDRANDRFDDMMPALRRSLHLASNERVAVYSIAPAAAGALWLGTNLGALHFDPGSGHARRLPVGIPVDASQPVRDVYADHDGSLWIASVGHGLLHYRDGFGVIRLYSQEDGLPDRGALRVTRDAGGTLWVGTLSGLARLDPITNRFQSFREDPARADSLAGRRIIDLRSASDGSLWVATDSGVNRLLSVDDGGAHFRRYLRRDGLPDATAYCAIDDGSGAIWISGNLGISRLDPATGKVDVLGLRKGLQGLEFNSAACLRDHDGALLFGGINGLNLIHPDDIAPSRYLAPTVITEFDWDGGHEPDNASESTIPPSARVVRFAFAALDYAEPRNNRFRYRLVGLDPEWIDNGTASRVTYTNLGPGEYRFEVRGSNRDGVFGATPAVVRFRIASPWWDTTTAKSAATVLGLLALLLVALGLRRRHRLQREYQRTLQESEERFRLALWASGDQYWEWDLRSDTLSRIGTALLGDNESGQTLAMEDWRRHVLHPADLERVERLAQEYFEGKTPLFESEHRITTSNGTVVWVRARGKIIERDAEGKPVRMCGVVHDAAPQRSAEHDSRVASEVLRSMDEAVAVTDLDFHFIAINPAFVRMLGYKETDVVGRDTSLVDSQQHPQSTYRAMREALRRDGSWHGELWQRRKNGEEFLAWLKLSEVLDMHGERSHFVCVMSDITDRKRAEQELRYLANYDALTGLPNRTMLVDRLGHAISQARRTGRKVAVLFLDLDRFKQVNDSMGHAAGDRMLKAAGTRLRTNVRDVDTVSRLGGDEFCVVLEDLADTAIADRVCAALIGAFEEPLQIDAGQEIAISPSIGIALFPEHGATPADLLKFADTAMYQAKARGRNTWAMYTEAMDALARRHATMLNALRQALHGNELSVVYQPKLDIGRWEITGVEALLRWDSPSLGSVPPGVFIPLAEEAGLIVDFGAFVLDQACATLARWRNHDIRNVSMAVNISSAQLLGRTLVNHLGTVLERHHIQPALIELELTESLVMTDAETSLRTLRELKAIGVRLAIDDFGTGYSSFAYLKRLPIDTLKIDKEFIGDLTTDPDDEEITTAIISMAHSLGLKVVAEGVQTLEQVRYLDEKDCDEMQGNWFSPPLPARDCLALLCRHDPVSRPAFP